MVKETEGGGRKGALCYFQTMKQLIVHLPLLDMLLVHGGPPPLPFIKFPPHNSEQEIDIFFSHTVNTVSNITNNF